MDNLVVPTTLVSPNLSAWSVSDESCSKIALTEKHSITSLIAKSCLNNSNVMNNILIHSVTPLCPVTSNKILLSDKPVTPPVVSIDSTHETVN